jgi:hypothetical protein
MQLSTIFLPFSEMSPLPYRKLPKKQLYKQLTVNKQKTKQTTVIKSAKKLIVSYEKILFLG